MWDDDLDYVCVCVFVLVCVHVSLVVVVVVFVYVFWLLESRLDSNWCASLLDPMPHSVHVFVCLYGTFLSLCSIPSMFVCVFVQVCRLCSNVCV